MRELDYSQLEAAAKAGHLDSVGRALGIELTDGAWLAVQRWSNDVKPSLVLAVIHRALNSPVGISHECFEPTLTHCLAVRADDVLAISASPGRLKSPATIWPSLEGWKRKLESNEALARAWSMTDKTLELLESSEELGELRSLQLHGSFNVKAVVRFLEARCTPNLEDLYLGGREEQLTHAQLDTLYGAALRLAEVTPLKSFPTPYDDRKSHPLLERLRSRLGSKR